MKIFSFLNKKRVKILRNMPIEKRVFLCYNEGEERKGGSVQWAGKNDFHEKTEYRKSDLNHVVTCKKTRRCYV